MFLVVLLHFVILSLENESKGRKSLCPDGSYLKFVNTNSLFITHVIVGWTGEMMNDVDCSACCFGL